jgi:aspartate kinase
MLTVEKIGGTSMSRFGDVLRNIIEIKPKGEFYNRIFVVSAYANVTNWLLEDKKTGKPGIYARFAEQQDCQSAIQELLIKLLDINKGLKPLGLDLRAAESFIIDRVQKTGALLEDMTEVMASGYVDRRSILLAAREVLASIGEAHSAYNSTEILKHRGWNAVFVDLSGFHDSEALTIDERIHKSLQGIVFSKKLAVVTGFTRGTEGIMREFDRGYTEVTFAKIAVEVGADEAVIHKEFHLSSADPKVVGKKQAIPVGDTNYDVADQLADIGMEAIHPRASKPLERAGINLRIKNTFEPKHEGTLISRRFMGEKDEVELIAGSDKVTIIEIHDSSMVGEVGFDLGVMQIFRDFDTSYMLKATNANSISMVIRDSKNEALVKALRKRYQRVTVQKVALVCVIGSNISKPTALAEATRILSENKIPVKCVSQSLRQVNIQFVIDRRYYRKAVIALNMALCLNRPRPGG